MTPSTVVFDSAGVQCSAWHYAGTGTDFATDAGRPCVVMAHGLGGTKDSGLAPFADAFANAGLDVFAFDYRGFGESGGEPRQTVSMKGQLADYRAAMSAAAALDGVDAGRLVLWGVSLAGGHVLSAAVGRGDVAAVVALVPLVDGVAAGVHALKSHSPAELQQSTGRGLRGRLAELTGRPAVTIPLVARPGEVGAMTTPGAYEDYLAIAGPTWRNEVAASVLLELGNYRPGRDAKGLRVPLLVQIADLDLSAPPNATAKAAFAAKAEVRRYPCDHFDVFASKEWHDAAVEHELLFLRRHLRP
jgi:pimeloyl-ACP methyl ester carboxylesterase